MTAVALSQDIAKLRERIRVASQKWGREPGAVTLLAVSKTRPARAIREAAAAGIADFGENYVQEALDKMAQLRDLPLCWHFIGPIQSNKTRAIAENFQWVHSVDRLKIARRLSEQRPDTMPPLQVCLQVNISAEASKAGVPPAALPDLAGEVAKLPGLRLRGLMAIPVPTSDFEQQRQPFAAIRLALESLQSELPELDTLSMGMSGDLEAAICEGATILRIGTALFGPR
jgi:pyridoxal phosphate enzyme (YggS family)